MVLKRVLLTAMLSLPLAALAEYSMVGQWVMPVANNPQCSEQYQFGDNNEFAVTSGMERAAGRYEQQNNGAGLSQLNVNFTFDNQMTDCFGSNLDQTGMADTHFLKWHNENVVQWCSDVTGQNCPVTLYRQ